MPVSLDDLFSRLLDAWGPQQWWPAETPFEVIVGAVLVQNTAWKNVRRAIDQLSQAGRLSPHAIHTCPQAELETLIRPAGYYRVKAKRLRHLVDFLITSYDGSVDAMRAAKPELLRAALLEVHGVGPETADSILLYAAEMPSFVVDTYTHRVLVRHGWIEPDADYYAIKQFFESRLEPDVALYNEFHALLVRVGHLHCRKHPSCDTCPLVDLLPEGGIREPG